ncbi:MAG: tetratricopeptide repeat protein, partial [Xanthobacteraceae bacterium]
MLQDIRGHRLTGATNTSLPHYEAALRELNLFINDPVATVDKAIAESPDFVMAHLLKAWLHLLGTEPAGTAVALEALETTWRLASTGQEQGHIVAISHLAAGRWHLASQVLEDIAIEYPRDLLALQAGHQLDFFRGDARMLRDRVTRALPAWSPKVPGYHTVLGMQAFGLEESGHYAEAERCGHEAVELEPRDAW